MGTLVITRRKCCLLPRLQISRWTCKCCQMLYNANSFSLQTFLTSNKERVDDDPDANPYDDLRHYAYEVWTWLLVLFCPMFTPLLFRAMAILGAPYRHWIPAQMMPTLSLNTSTTLGLGMQWYSWLFSRPSSFNFWDLGVSTFASFHFQSQQVQETCWHVRPGVWLRRVWGLLCSIMKPPIQTKLQWNNF